MTTGFAEEMERKARDFIDRLIEDGVLAKELYEDDRNFKPWYSPRDLIDQAAQDGGIDRVLIGVNPGGCPGENDPTTKDRRWEREWNPSKPFNAYIDEKWKTPTPGDAPLQRAVQNVFEAFYDTKWEPKLRKTICFNVCPIRTANTKEHNLPEPVWSECVEWCQKVLDHLRPKVIVCNGNGQDRSAWTAVCGMYQTVYMPKNIPIKKNVQIKYGRFRRETEDSFVVVGVPHLSRFASSDLYYKIRKNQPEILGPA